MKSRCRRRTGPRLMTGWGSSAASSFVELVFDLFGQRIVEVIRNRELALGRAEDTPVRPHALQMNHRQLCPVSEMAAHGLTHIQPQLIHGFSLREDRVAESAG